MNVIKALGICVVVSICVCLSACAAKGTASEPTTVPVTSSASATQPTTTQTTAAEDEKRIYEQGDNYVVYAYADVKVTDDYKMDSYRCEIYNDEHEILAYEYFDWRGVKVVQNGDEIALWSSSGGSVFSKKYYDLKRGRVSLDFVNPICENKDKVAYYALIDGKNYVVVQDKYDRAAYYKRFQRDFSSAFATVNANASFSADGKTLTTSYPTMEGDKEIQKTEIFPLY